MLPVAFISKDSGPAYSPFPFVTVSNPAVDHTGVSARPGYSPTDPPSAAVTDPMSGIALFRVGGNFGSTVFINGTQNSGLVFPHRLRSENAPYSRKCWNSDSSLLMIDRYFSISGDPGNSAASYLIDVTGTRGASAPWRILRASSQYGLGDGNVQNWWFWDPNDPLRAFVLNSNGSIDEWWPIGGNGHSPGEINNLWGAPAGLGGFRGMNREMVCSVDGLFHISECQETSGLARFGGIRRNLSTGALGPFVPNPFVQQRGANGTSWTGRYTYFTPNGNDTVVYDASNGTLAGDTRDTDDVGLAHPDFSIINGVEYLTGCRDDAVRGMALPSGTMRTFAAIPGSNPNHVHTGNRFDLAETYGSAGSGQTTGQRYLIYARSNPNSGHPRAIMGIRMGPNDIAAIRYICNHRSVRTTNSNEVHPQMSPDARLLLFPSNWQEPGVTMDGDVHPYVAMLPDAWRSPNNNGS